MEVQHFTKRQDEIDTEWPQGYLDKKYEKL